MDKRTGNSGHKSGQVLRLHLPILHYIPTIHIHHLHHFLRHLHLLAVVEVPEVVVEVVMAGTVLIGSICCLVQAVVEVEAEVEVVEEVAIGVAAAIIPTIGMTLLRHHYPMMQACLGLR